MAIYSSTCYFDISSNTDVEKSTWAPIDGMQVVQRCFFNFRSDFFSPQTEDPLKVSGTGNLAFLSTSSPETDGTKITATTATYLATSDSPRATSLKPSSYLTSISPVSSSSDSTIKPPSHSPPLASSTSLSTLPTSQIPFLQRTVSKTPVFRLARSVWDRMPTELELVRKGIGFRFYWGWEPPSTNTGGAKVHE
jgi:hypothetical protein